MVLESFRRCWVRRVRHTMARSMDHQPNRRSSHSLRPSVPLELNGCGQQLNHFVVLSTLGLASSRSFLDVVIDTSCTYSRTSSPQTRRSADHFSSASCRAVAAADAKKTNAIHDPSRRHLPELVNATTTHATQAYALMMNLDPSISASDSSSSRASRGVAARVSVSLPNTSHDASTLLRASLISNPVILVQHMTNSNQGLRYLSRAKTKMRRTTTEVWPVSEDTT